MSDRQRVCSISLATLLVGVVIAGCSANTSEIEEWMVSVRESTPPVKNKIKEPKKFEPYRYDIVEAIAPFSPTKLAALQDPMVVRAKGGLAPDTNRRREVLENFPLEQIQMVGYMRRRSANTALLQIDKTVYQAKIGNYAGRNFGVITGIDETSVLLRELVQDATGDWVERETTLKLQENAK